MKLYFTPKAYRKMMAWTRASDDELSGVGQVSVGKDGLDGLLVEDVWLLSSEDSRGATHITAKDMGPFLYKYQSEGGDPSKLKLWWHSHNSMPAFWSRTDEETILREPMGSSPEVVQWWVSVVVNHKGEYKARYDTHKGQSKGMEIVVLYSEDDGGPFVELECQRELEARRKRQDRDWDVEFFCDTWLEKVRISSCFDCWYQLNCHQFWGKFEEVTGHAREELDDRLHQATPHHRP